MLAALGHGAQVYAEPVAATQRSEVEQPRELLVQVQKALDLLAKGELALKQSAGEGQPEALVEARDALRSAISQFRQVRASLDDKLTEHYRRPKAKRINGWTTNELESLRRNLSLKWARALRHQALCYPRNSADQLNSLDGAIEQLRDLTTSKSNEPAVWQARGDVLLCLRLLGQNEKANERLTHWEAKCPPAMRARLIRQPQSIEKKISGIQEQRLAGARLYAMGNLTEALAAYDRAAELASKSGEMDSYYRSAQTAAAICDKLAKPQAAVERYRKLALGNKNHALAAQSHLTAIGIVVAELRNDDAAQKPSLSEQYENLLAEHLKYWPDGPQADKVRMWQDRLTKMLPPKHE